MTTLSQMSAGEIVSCYKRRKLTIIINEVDNIHPGFDVEVEILVKEKKQKLSHVRVNHDAKVDDLVTWIKRLKSYDAEVVRYNI